MRQAEEQEGDSLQQLELSEDAQLAGLALSCIDQGCEDLGC